jgi:hypothetical protein
VAVKTRTISAAFSDPIDGSREPPHPEPGLHGAEYPHLQLWCGAATWLFNDEFIGRLILVMIDPVVGSRLLRQGPAGNPA